MSTDTDGRTITLELTLEDVPAEFASWITHVAEQVTGEVDDVARALLLGHWSRRLAEQEFLRERLALVDFGEGDPS